MTEPTADLEQALAGLHRELEQLRDQQHDPACRCDRMLVCQGCTRPPGDCTCDPVFADLEEYGPDGEDAADLDPLTRTLLGLPSGIHCHTNGCRDA